MFFFSTTGPILPYVISLLILWSGVWFGYGKYLLSKNNSEEHNEVKLQETSYSEASNKIYELDEYHDFDYNDNIISNIYQNKNFGDIYFAYLLSNYLNLTLEIDLDFYLNKIISRGPPYTIA